MTDNQTLQPLSDHHPLMVAWLKYRRTDAYRNARRWAGQPEHLDDSLWAMFMSGWEAADNKSKPEIVEKYNGDTKLGASALALGSLALTGLGVAFGTFQMMIGICIFTVPIIIITMSMAHSPKWD